jgi:cyclase
MKGAADTLKNFVKAKNITIVNTHSHFDHVGGNALYPQATIIAGAYSKKQWDEDGKKYSRYPDIPLAPGEEKIIKIGAETVHIYNTGRAHTWNDVVVYLENRKLLVTGDLVFHQWHPALVAQSGTNVTSWMRVLDVLSGKYRIRTLVPGHGIVTDQNALVAMKNYFVRVSDSSGNSDKQAAVKEEYRNYVAVPGVFSFNNTLKFIEQESK